MWANNQYININNYLSNVLLFKFDFGFIHKFTFDNNKIGCQFESNKMADLNFYCQSTLQNYFFMLLIASTAILLWIFSIIVNKSKKLNILWSRMQELLYWKKDNNKISQTRQHFIEWFVINLMIMFILINILNDVLDFLKHIYLSLLSLVFIVVAWIYLYKTHFRIFQLIFIIEMEPVYSNIASSKLFQRQDLFHNLYSLPYLWYY